MRDQAQPTASWTSWAFSCSVISRSGWLLAVLEPAAGVVGAEKGEITVDTEVSPRGRMARVEEAAGVGAVGSLVGASMLAICSYGSRAPASCRISDGGGTPRVLSF